MMVQTISFDIFDFTTHTPESFLVEHTLENEEKVLTLRNSRNIQFTKTLDFQFKREMHIPLSFIKMDTWVRLLNTNPGLFAGVADLELAA